MSAIDQASELTTQAIQILLAERQRIDDILKQLGHGQEKTTTMKRRGRPPKELSPTYLSDSSEEAPTL